MIKATGIIFFLALSVSALSQGLFEEATSTGDEEKEKKIELGGYARGSVYGGSEFYDYSSVFGEFSLQGEASWKNAFLFADLRFRMGLEFDEEYTALEIKEAYAGYQSKWFDGYLGQQIVTWGRADGFNPTNNITPDNYFFFSANPDDQKLSNFLLRTKIHFTPLIDLEVIGIPYYKPSIYRYNLFDLGEYTYFIDGRFPEKSFSNGSLAAKFNFELPEAGFSLSWFRGYDPFYGFNLNRFWADETGPHVELIPDVYLKNTIGGDIAVPFGSFIARGEFAYNITTNYQDNMFIPNPNLSYVAGLEYNIKEYVIILQYIGKYTLDFTELPSPDPGNPLSILDHELTTFNRKIFYQQEEFTHAVSLTVNKQFAYQKIPTEAFGYYNLTSKEWMIRPKFGWHITDALKLSIGGFITKGPDKSLCDYAADVMNGAFMELKMSF